ncbi:MAG: AAA family ATPase [Lachnospiraceae bacterium]|nr:AAA family ATPase [Lachnospiraceae bacterium]
MRISAIVYNKKYAVERVILPGQKEAILLDRHLFGLKESISFSLAFQEEKVYVGAPAFGKPGIIGLPSIIYPDSDVINLKGLTDKGEILMLTLIFSVSCLCNLYRVNKKSISLGSDMTNTIFLSRLPLLSTMHLKIEYLEEGWSLLSLGVNGCFLNGSFIERGASLELCYGDEILLWGVKLVWLQEELLLIEERAINNVNALSSLVRLEKIFEGSHKSGLYREELLPLPRMIKYRDLEPVELEAAPKKKEIKKESFLMAAGPAFTMALPMLAGTLLALYLSKREGSTQNPYMYTGIITALSSALLGLLWTIINLRGRKKEKKREERKRKKLYKSYMDRSEDRIRKKYCQNKEVLFYMYPSAGELIKKESRDYLWNREQDALDLLHVRLGLGRIQSGFEINVPKERLDTLYDEMRDFPLMVRDKYKYYEKAPVILDLKDNKVIGILGENRLRLRQLFYLLLADLTFCISPKRLKIVIISINDLLSPKDMEALRYFPHIREERPLIAFGSKEALSMLGEISAGSDRELLVITDEIKLLNEGFLERTDPRIAVMVNSYEKLPRECSLVIENHESFCGIFSLKNAGSQKEVSFDDIAERDVRKLSSILNRIPFLSEGEDERIAKRVVFSDVFKALEVADIVNNYNTNDTLLSIDAPIGSGKGGSIISLDLHERGYGPHGLIAGMTGSGKSELLQSLVLSLALRYSPQKLNFFLIDYKGGGMANCFKNLPHLCGSISNLSQNISQRAMLSIRSENERRQRLFLKEKVNNISSYEKKLIMGEKTELLPHILIIIDEFAELKKNEPDFMKELISVAQVGRSLGIHLILATQKPSGVVDENIYSNSKFRIALRVQDRMDSMDMLGKPDASMITVPGRAYLEVGNMEYFEEFQSIYSMNTSGQEEKNEKVYVTDEKGIEYEVNGEARKEDGFVNSKAETDLSLLLGRIEEASARCGFSPPRKLWMKELPKELKIRNEEILGEKKEFCYPVGIYDAPIRQEQDLFKVDMEKMGHIIVCGRAGSGKSNLLMTVLYAMMIKEDPSSMNIYIVDHGGGGLSVFSKSRMVGGYVGEEEEDKLGKLFIMLKRILGERKKNREIKAPKLLLVIDNYGGFRGRGGESYEGELMELLKQGEGYGIWVIISGNQIGIQDISQRIMEYVKTVICLEMTDKMQYLSALRVNRLSIYPTEEIRGRAIAFVKKDLLEIQTGLCPKDTEKVIEERNKNIKGYARAIPTIPKKPLLSDFLERINEEGVKKGCIPLGYNVFDGEIAWAELGKFNSFFITGKKGSGKSNYFRIIETLSKPLGAEICYVNSIGELADMLEEVNEGNRLDERREEDQMKLMLIEEGGSVIDKFYVNNYSMEAEKRIINIIKESRNVKDQYLNPPEEEKSLHNIIISLRSEDIPLVKNRSIFEVLREGAYGLHLGGLNDSQSIFDFSELNFSQKNRPKKSGEGNIPFLCDELFSGEVKLPLWAG